MGTSAVWPGLLVTLTLLQSGCISSAGDITTTSEESALSVATSDLYVSGFFSSSVQRFAGPYAATPGAARPSPHNPAPFYAQKVSRRPWAIAFGHDESLFVTDDMGNGVSRFHG